MECLEEIKTTTKLATFKSNLKTMAFYLCFPPVHHPLGEKKKVGIRTRACRGVEAGGKMEMWSCLFAREALGVCEEESGIYVPPPIARNTSGTSYSDIYSEVSLTVFFTTYRIQILMKLP